MTKVLSNEGLTKLIQLSKDNFVSRTNVTQVSMVNLQTIATSVSPSSTNDEVVGAKLFYDTVGNIEAVLHAINSGS